MKKIFLIAKKLSHSFSPLIHSYLGNYSYALKELEENDLDDFFRKKDFDGLNVTIPYKTTVMKYLDEISPEAKEIGAVNTITNINGKLYGYNTDYFGFLYMLKESKADVKDKKVLVVGNGGASKTVVIALKDEGARKVSVLTHKENTQDGIKKYLDAQIIVNTTPVGMFPNNNIAPVDLSRFKNCEAVLDVIYNPSVTKLISDAKENGMMHQNGLGMLVAQAKKAAEFFTNSKIEDKIIPEIEAKIKMKTLNIVLVGMPGSGKTTIGKMIAERLGREFFDTDEIIASKGISPENIILKEGEEAFRKIETEVIDDVSKKSGVVIATGGGAVTKDENRLLLAQNSVVVYIRRPIELLATKGRPLSKNIDTLKQMLKIRQPMYLNFCDFEIDNMGKSKEAARALVSEFMEYIGV